MTGLTVVNFSHPLTDDQLDELRRRLDRGIDRVVDAPTHFDHGRPFAEQAAALLDGVDVAWETTALVVNLPSFGPIVAVVLARLHGLMGHFPTIVRLRPVEGAVPTRFEVAEVIDLNTVRIRAAQVAKPRGEYHHG
jgi:hypothetical protein